MALGLAAALLAAGCYECGYVLQALDARTAPAGDALRASLLVRLAARRRWLAGTALSLVGALLQIVALALAPVTLVQPVLALGLVALLLLARTRLGEHVGSLEAAGAAAVIAGVAAVGVESPGRTSGVTSVLALVLLLAPVGLLALAPFALRRRAPLALAAAGAAGGDALAAVALKLTANAAALGRPALAVLGAAAAAVAGGLALTAEMSALRGLPASRVAPVVLAAQVIVPAIAAMAAFGEPVSAPVVLGVAAAGAGAGLLGASGAIAGLRSGGAQPEALAHHGGRAWQGGERVVGRAPLGQGAPER
jgi:drug/metabolite transporter (DMT)-like permease